MPSFVLIAAVLGSLLVGTARAHYPIGGCYGSYGYRSYVGYGVSFGYPRYCGFGGYGFRSYGIGGYGLGYYSSCYYPSYYSCVSPAYCGYAPYVYRPYVVCNPVVVAAPVCGPVVVPPVGGVGVPGGAPVGPPLIENPKVEKKEEPPPAPKRPKANQAARDRAWRFIRLGDQAFGRAEYLQAYQRYKLAVQAAPDLVEAYLRRGQSLVALANYELAAGTFKHAFTLTPDWARTDYRLDTIYGDRREAKASHLDRLAEAAEEKLTADLMMLIGAQLYYDGQADRSLKFFRRAKELSRGGEVPVPVLKGEKAAPPRREAAGGNRARF